MRTSTPFALFSFALALYAAPFAVAAGSSKGLRQLSDQDLFEVHLQQAAGSSHKRLPSEVMTHHERSEEDEVVAAPAADSSATSSTSAEAEDSSALSKSYSARQPSHFIKHFKHRSNKLGKRRLREDDLLLHFERDSDDLDSSVWHVPALVARVLEESSAIFSTSEAASSTETTSKHTPTTIDSQQGLQVPT